MKRTFTIGMVALLLTLAVLRAPALGRFVSSARTFGRQFYALRCAPTISPLERIVLSLAATS